MGAIIHHYVVAVTQEQSASLRHWNSENQSWATPPNSRIWAPESLGRVQTRVEAFMAAQISEPAISTLDEECAFTGR